MEKQEAEAIQKALALTTLTDENDMSAIRRDNDAAQCLWRTLNGTLLQRVAEIATRYPEISTARVPFEAEGRPYTLSAGLAHRRYSSDAAVWEVIVSEPKASWPLQNTQASILPQALKALEKLEDAFKFAQDERRANARADALDRMGNARDLARWLKATGRNP